MCDSDMRKSAHYFVKRQHGFDLFCVLAIHIIPIVTLVLFGSFDEFTVIIKCKHKKRISK